VRIRVYGRKDLSGKFRITTDGTIDVPLLGTLPVAGATRAEAKTVLTEAVMHASVQSTDISLEVARWRPLYVVGEVNKPGALPFEPGMTVLHALAVAGGFYRPGNSTSVIVDSSRAHKDLQEAKLQLVQALARRARMEAEVDGRKRAEAPKALEEFVDQPLSEKLMAAENRILARSRLSLRTQDASLRKQIGHASSERVAYQQQLAKVEQQIDLTNQELARIKHLAERGLTPQTRVLQLQRQVADLESEGREIVADVSRSQRVLAITRREHARLEIERRLKVERELLKADADILLAQQKIRAAQALLRQLTSLSSQMLKAPSEPSASYKVMRVISGKMASFYVTETALLCPGDVIQVIRGKPPHRASEAQEHSSVRTEYDQK